MIEYGDWGRIYGSTADCDSGEAFRPEEGRCDRIDPLALLRISDLPLSLEEALGRDGDALVVAAGRTVPLFGSVAACSVALILLPSHLLHAFE